MSHSLEFFHVSSASSGIISCCSGIICLFSQDLPSTSVTSALLAQSVERETLSPHDLKRRDSQYISRLRVRPPRRACTLCFLSVGCHGWVVVNEFLVADVCGGAMRQTTTTTSPTTRFLTTLPCDAECAATHSSYFYILLFFVLFIIC
jgi:hypothetical protein